MHNRDEKPIGNAALTLRLLLLAAAMFAFGFALVPLYDVFCEITGFGGRTNTVAATVAETPVEGRSIRVEFVTTLNEYAPWEFSADTPSMSVRPGQMYLATFTAENLTQADKVAQAVPSVAPIAASKHFKKLECFCFTSQAYAPAETRSMPMQFIVDPDIPEYIDTITLQYTLYDTLRLSAASEQ